MNSDQPVTSPPAYWAIVCDPPAGERLYELPLRGKGLAVLLFSTPSAASQFLQEDPDRPEGAMTKGFSASHLREILSALAATGRTHVSLNPSIRPSATRQSSSFAIAEFLNQLDRE